MTIYERALAFVADGDGIGLGTGRAASAFLEALAAKVQEGALKVRGVPTSRASADLAQRLGIPVIDLEEGMPLAVTVDGADEVAPDLDLIKGRGRALVREKVVATASKRLVILVGKDKTVPALGTRGQLPVEVVPFAAPLVRRRLEQLDLAPVLDQRDGQPFVTDNGNHILDCTVGALLDPPALEAQLRAIPGVVGTGLFLGLADVVLVGDPDKGFALIDERERHAPRG